MKDKTKLINVLKKCTPGIEKESGIIEGSDTFTFTKNNVYTYNDHIAISITNPMPKLEGSVNASDLFKVINKFGHMGVTVGNTLNEMSTVADQNRAQEFLRNTIGGSTSYHSSLYDTALETAVLERGINSPGGLVTAGLAVYDTMQYIKPDIATVCIGQAASMGALLLTAGTKGKRYSLPHARIMIHQPMGGFHGQASDVEIQAQEILRLKDTINRMLVRHTGNSLSQIKKDTDRDFFMSGEEAKKYGIIDNVMSNRDDLKKFEELKEEK